MAGKICAKCETEMSIIDGYWVCINGHRINVAKEEQVPDWVDDDMLNPQEKEEESYRL